MDSTDLQSYLHNHIPLSKAMGIHVETATFDGVTLTAPLAPNINHRDTLFGGSASAVAILAAWTLLHVRLTEIGLPSRVVIQRNTMKYDKPVAEDFYAIALPPEPDNWHRFQTMLRKKHRARITIFATLHSNDEIAGKLEGDFVAFGK